MLDKIKSKLDKYKIDKTQEENRKAISLDEEDAKYIEQKKNKGLFESLFGFIKVNRVKVPLLQFYIDMAASLLTKGGIDLNFTPDEGKIYYTTNKIITKNALTKVYLIYDYPEQLDRNIVSILRSGIPVGAELTRELHVRPYVLNLDSHRIKNRIRLWKRRYEDYEREETVKATTEKVFEKREKILTNRANVRMIDSWVYLQESIDRRRELCKTFMALRLSAKDANTLEDAHDFIRRYFYNNEIGYTDLTLQIYDFNKRFSLANLDYTGPVIENYPPYILNNDILAQMYTYRQGQIGDDYGLLMGIDMDTGLPVFKNARKGSEAQNILVAADTGGGKSLVCKVLLGYGMAQGFCVIIIDYEGDEYVPLGLLSKAKFIKLHSSDSIYFDTMEIGELTGDDEIDNSLKTESINITKIVFDLLCDLDEGMSPTELAIFNDAINKLHRDKGITEDKNTWHKSQGLTYKDLYNTILGLREDKVYYKRYGKSLDLFIDKLRIYLSDEGIKSYMFKNKMSFNELKDSDYLIFLFGAKGATSSTIDKRDFTLKQLFVSYISTRLTNYNKYVKKKFTIKFFEELQRYLRHKGSSEIVVNDITGARKRDAVCVIATNDPLGLIEGEYEGGQAIIDNITTTVLGTLKPETVEAVTNRFGLHRCVDILHRIADEAKYKHCFLLSLDLKEHAIIKMMLPKWLAETPLYKTRNEEGKGLDETKPNKNHIKVVG